MRILDKFEHIGELCYKVHCNNININKSLELMTSYMVDEDYDMLGCINMVDDSAIMLYGKNSSRRLDSNEGLCFLEQILEASHEQK